MRALLVVDLQNTFCPGGKLPVPFGDRIVPIVKKLMASALYQLKVASKDAHPANHGSFASQHPGAKEYEMGELNGIPQRMWPDHGVDGTEDAEFHPDIDATLFDYIQKKGQDPLVDSYSAFRDNAKKALTALADYLISKGITELDVCGLATEFCVCFSALDAVEFLPGVKVRFISDASAGLSEDAIADAIEKMRNAGIEIVTSDELLAAA